MAKTYTYDVISGPSSTATHAIAAPAMPFDPALHAPLCGAHLRAATVTWMFMTCQYCLQRLAELQRQGYALARSEETAYG